MKKTIRGLFAFALVAAVTLAAAPAFAQDDEGPANRVVVVTTFDLPYQHRGAVFPWMEEYFIPAVQLNPHVISARVLTHLYGSHGSRVAIVAEYADIADIEADCGAPCEEYYEAHPAPEEGEEGYEENREAVELFNKYFSHHEDMIWSSNSEFAKTEGELVGNVGPDE